MRREAFTIKAGGRRLAALRLTPEPARAGPTLVFLHEGLGCIGMWRDVPARLCERLALPGLVYDRWGYGGSEPFDRPRTPRYLHDEAETALPEALAAAGIERPVLVGHSDGGTIALLFAATFPSRPAAVVAIAAHIYVEEVTRAGVRDAVRQWEEGDLRARLARWHRDEAEAVFRAWADTWLSEGFRSWNLRDALAAITCPTLILQGGADPYATEAQFRVMGRGVPGARAALLPGLGHSPHLQGREKTLELVYEFLTSTGY